MKILHTSDWHLGHTLYGYDRTDEQEHMLKQIVDLVREKKPDVIIISGDVFHSSTPSASSQTMLSDALVNICDACPDVTVVMTAGNHDSASKHEIYKKPWRRMRVHAIGNISAETPEDHIVIVPGVGFVVGMPYAHPRNLPDGFIESIMERVRKMNTENLPVILSAHTAVGGVDFSGHEDGSKYSVGGIDYVSTDYFGNEFDYVALGHIHKPQTIRNEGGIIRYSGTPLPISFDENYPHSVSWIEVGSHGDEPEVSEIAIKSLFPLITLPSHGWSSWEEARLMLRNLENDLEAYIRLNIAIEDRLPDGAHSEAINLLEGKKARFCHINIKKKEESSGETSTGITVDEFRKKTPLDIVRQFASDTNMDFDEEMEAMIKQVMELIRE